MNQLRCGACLSPHAAPLRAQCWAVQSFGGACSEQMRPGNGPGNRKCRGWCTCNTFGCNCEACGDCTRDSDSPFATSVAVKGSAEAERCADHAYYTSLSAAEKHAHLEAKLCPAGHRAHAALADRLEKLVDGDHDGILSCAEFDRAYPETMLAHIPAWNHSKYMASLAECAPAEKGDTKVAAKGALQPAPV